MATNFKNVQPVFTHVGGPWSQVSLKNTARQIHGHVDGTQKAQLCHLHMKRGSHLLPPGPEDVKGGFVREFMLLLDGISVGGQST